MHPIEEKYVQDKHNMFEYKSAYQRLIGIY